MMRVNLTTFDHTFINDIKYHLIGGKLKVLSIYSQL